jgi:uncharacterized protein HemY
MLAVALALALALVILMLALAVLMLALAVLAQFCANVPNKHRDFFSTRKQFHATQASQK